MILRPFKSAIDLSSKQVRLENHRGRPILMNKRMQLVAWMGSRIGKPPGWHRIARRFAPSAACRELPDVIVVRNGLSFVVQPSEPIGWNILFQGTFEPELREILSSLLQKSAVAIDVGANTGWHTSLMSRLVGDGGRVIAIEPNPAVVRRLHENIALNHLGNVDVFPLALSDRDEIAAFHESIEDPGQAHLVGTGERACENTTRVETRRLDRIVEDCGLTRLDLIKIDVEGYEWPVFRGAERTIDKFKPHIIFEFSAESAGRGGGTAEQISHFFQTRDYRLFAIGLAGAQAIDLGTWPRWSDIWAVPPHRTRG